MSHYHGSAAQRHTARRAAENIAAGRQWLLAHVYHLDPGLMLTEEEIIAKIDILYVGGWRAFVGETKAFDP